jgi:hypothetical protein
MSHPRFVARPSFNPEPAAKAVGLDANDPFSATGNDELDSVGTHSLRR